MVNRKGQLGDPRDKPRGVALSLAVLIIIFAIVLSQISMPALRAISPVHAWTVYVLLALSCVLSFYVGRGIYMDILRRLGAALREALGASRDEDEFSRASIHVNEDPGPRTFWMLISAVVLLAGSVVYLVLVTGGVENSPFLQFLLNYFVCGILMTREIRAKVLLLAISVVLPFAVLAVGAAVEIDGGARDFSASNYAVLTAVCVLIVGIVNLIVGPKVTYEGDSASPEGDDLRAA